MSLVSLESAQPSRTGLEIADGIGFNEWRRLLERIVRMGDSAAWWIGDCLAYGERFRRDYREWFDRFDRSNETLRKYAWVASRVAPPFRAEQLSFTHHQLVARFEPDEQARWLDDAARHGWTTRELEQAIAETRSGSVKAPALTIRAVGELRELCAAAALAEGIDPAEWAAGVLERAARRVLHRKVIG